jgi:membrane protein YdbS with pleckstrin-like domain
LTAVIDRRRQHSEAVGNAEGQAVIPAEALASGEHTVYGTRPLLWSLLIGPTGVIILGLSIIAVSGFAARLELEPYFALLELEPYSARDVVQLILAVIRFTGIAVSLAGLVRILITWLRWRYTIYAITDRRILRQTGIIGKSYVDCPLGKVHTIYLDIPILGRIFGFGTIRVATAGAAWIGMQWDGVGQPRKAQQVLNELIQQSAIGAASVRDGDGDRETITLPSH